MKYVRKWTPVSSYDIQGLESWLQDLALQGLYLEQFRPLFCTFYSDAAKRTRYRIEPHHRRLDDDLPRSMLELYESYGWTCVGEIGRELLIFVTQEEDAPELHTDPELQGEQWRKLVRRLRRGFFLSLFCFLLITVFCAWSLFEEGTPVLVLLTSAIPIVPLYLVLALFSLASQWGELQAVTQFTRQLEAGESLPHRAPYPKSRPGYLISFLASSVLLVLFLAAQYVLPFAGSALQPVEAAEAVFSPLSLADLEGENYRPYSVSFGSTTDYANFSQRKQYLLSTRWEVVQSSRWAPDGEDWVRLELLRYDLPAPLSFLSAPAARELLDQAMKLDDDIWWSSGAPVTWDVTYFPREDVQLLAIAQREGGTFQAAVAAAGDKVVLARYTGSAHLADHLEEIAAMVA